MSSPKSKRDDLSGRIYDVHNYDLDHNQRIIYLTGIEDHPGDDTLDPGVDYRQASRFIRNINILSSLDAEKPVLIILKNPGGYVEEAMAIYDSILAAPMPVTILGYACVASMASVIFQTANKRVIMPSATFMFHMGNTGADGTPKQVESKIEYDKMCGEKMLDIYVDAMKSSSHGKAHNWSRKRIREWLIEQIDKKEDVYLTGEQTVQFGLADEVFHGWPSLLEYTEEQLGRK